MISFDDAVIAGLAVTFVGAVALATWLAITWPTPEERTRTHAAELDGGQPWR